MINVNYYWLMVFNGNKELVIQVIQEILVLKVNQNFVSSLIFFGLVNNVEMV